MVDAVDSKSTTRKGVKVQVLFWALGSLGTKEVEGLKNPSRKLHPTSAGTSCEKSRMLPNPSRANLFSHLKKSAGRQNGCSLTYHLGNSCCAPEGQRS